MNEEHYTLNKDRNIQSKQVKQSINLLSNKDSSLKYNINIDSNYQLISMNNINNQKNKGCYIENYEKFSDLPVY